LECGNCPIEWNSSDIEELLSVGQALFLIAQYTVGYDIEEDDLCENCRYIKRGIKKGNEIQCHSK
jgi:hypothetical protein